MTVAKRGLMPLILSLLPALALAGDPRVGVQLWSVKDDLAADFEGTLRAVSELGFEGVEFARNYGPYEEDPEGLKALMDGLGLACIGAHVDFTMISAEQLAASLDYHQRLGCQSMVVAMDHRAFADDGVAWVIAELNLVAEKLDGTGMVTGYHNHWQEFAAHGDTTFWDTIAQHTTDDVVLQLDVGNMQPAGMDPVAYVRRYPGRTWSSHFKATLPEGASGRPIIGDDAIDWPGLLAAVREVGGTAWLIVEQEEYPDGLTPQEAVALSRAGLMTYMQGETP